MDNLGVSCKLVSSSEDFAEALKTDHFDFIFAASFLLYEARDKIREQKINATLALLAEYGEVISERQVRFIVMPVYSRSIAAILNGEKEMRGYAEDNSGVRFTAPEARVLLVDDIKTNLDVAQGLLAPYAMQVDSSLSGEEAIRRIQANRYDLALMDHMMPGMDGIETTKAVRALPGEYFQRLPIVVLTANAITGMKDIFLKTGFNDYISKPIEIVKLDEVIARWIPAEKQIKAGKEIKREAFSGESGIVIPNVDTQKGITMTGGTEAGYRKVLAQFYKDAEERLPLLQDPPEPDALPQFVTQVHALKSASATIGAAEVSAEAAALEAAGKDGNIAAIREGLSAFYEHLTELVEGIGNVMEVGRKEKSGEMQTGNTAEETVFNLLSLLKTALEEKNMKEIDKLLEELEKTAADAETLETINTVSDKTLLGEYQAAITMLDELLRK